MLKKRLLPTVVIFQHEPNDGPCFFAEYLRVRRRAYAVFQMWDDQFAAIAPKSVADTFHGRRSPAESVEVVPLTDSSEDAEVVCSVAGVACLGGYMSANDALPYYGTIETLFRSAVAHRVPVIGHCLGAQLLSKALGGTVQASPERELGWVQQSPAAEPHPLRKDWFRGREHLNVFHWHSESFSVPMEAFLVATGPHCPNQAFQVGDAYVLGMQFHCEIDRTKALHYLSEDVNSVLTTAEAERVGDNVACRMTKEALEATLAADDTPELEESRRLAVDIYDTWCEGLVTGPIA